MTKISSSVLTELLYADDCALLASSHEELQHIFDCFSSAARRFGLTISVRKTEALYQAPPHKTYLPPAVVLDGKPLKTVDEFKYLGSIVDKQGSLSKEITQRIAKASSAFGRLNKRLWKNSNIRLDTKIQVYRAVVLSTLLYGCETWTLKRDDIKRLERFHQKSLRRIAKIKWFHGIANYEVLEKCKICSLEYFLDAARLRWVGHVIRMKDGRIPKALLFGQLSHGKGSKGNHSSYTNKLKNTLRTCGINPYSFEQHAKNRSTWRSLCKQGLNAAELKRTEHLVAKRIRRHIFL